MNSRPFDTAIVGGGIVGLATALALSERRPGLRIAVLEKEARVAQHQTGHNSGVIHAGIYYKPGSHRARLCVQGVELMTAFCEAQGVPYERCGKVIVATSAEEVPRLENLFERGVANGVPGLRRISREELAEIEPHARAVAALHSPNTAIVDYGRVARAMADVLAGRGVEIRTGGRVRAMRRAGGLLELETARGTTACVNLINCGGLYSDQVARMAGDEPGCRIIPFRGEYYLLDGARRLVRGLIYPVPDPRFPFLGVHFTKRIGGDYEAGPNAVLALAREGYRKSSLQVTELAAMLAYRGFWAMAARYWRIGLYEMYRSFSRRAFVRALQVLAPDLADSDVSPGGAGVRAMAVSPAGALLDDFLIVEGPNTIHVLNAPSPAATASIAIGREIADRAGPSLDLGRATGVWGGAPL
jgi:L-2-hydroxyglutarate oxidase LhgO